LLIPVLAGAALGALTAVVVGRRQPSERGVPLAVFLAVAAGIYVGFGLRDGRPEEAIVQILGAVPFLVVAAWWPRDVGLQGAGWIAHGAWDAGHGLHIVGTTVPAWYPAACAAVDVVLGGIALYWQYRLRRPASRPGTS
jgi:hypothetical protein